MRAEVLIALFSKLLDEKLSELPMPVIGPRGHRGTQGVEGRDGRDGRDGKDFIFSEHEDQIKGWVKELALKFEDLSPEQIEQLKGRDGRDGKSFIFEENSEEIIKIISDQLFSMSETLKLKFSDLSEEEILKLRGPKGRDGKDGKDFVLEEHLEFFNGLKLKFSDLSDAEKNILKLKFSDLHEEDISKLRGPRGRDGRDGRDFIFDEHIEFFHGLKLKFSDLTPDEIDALRLKFKNLTSEEKEELKLKFSDLCHEDKVQLKGPRGQRGRTGERGDTGQRGPAGLIGPRGLPGPYGPRGISGADGQDGIDGTDGLDAPYIIHIRVRQNETTFVLIFEFSDGTEIESDSIDIPKVIKESWILGGGISSGTAFQTNLYGIIDGQLATPLVNEVFDGVYVSSVYYIAEIARGTDVFQTGPISMHYRNGAWHAIKGGLLSDNGIDSRLNFTVAQVGTIGTLNLAATAGAGNGEIKLKRISFSA